MRFTVALFGGKNQTEPDLYTLVIVARINNALTSMRESKHLKIVTANYNCQGNLILSTRTDQTATELLKHEDILRPVLAQLSGNKTTLIYKDKKWYKLQVNEVNTGALTVGDRRVLHTTDKVHDELLICNPHYAALTKHLVAKLRWLRTNEELLTTPRSSLVFALDDEQKYKDLLNL